MHVDKEEVLARFDAREVNEEQKARIARVRAQIKEAVRHILVETLPSREQSLALTHLEEASFFAVASIARE